MKLLQIDYGDGVIGEVVEKLIGYKWGVYFEEYEEPVTIGRTFHFIDALSKCCRYHARLALCRIREWKKL